MGQFIAFSAVGFIIILFSYLVKYKKQAFLISGYNEDEVADKDGLCNWMGGTLIWPGVSAIIAGAVIWLKPVAEMPAALTFGAVTIVAVIIALTGSRKFMKKQD